MIGTKKKSGHVLVAAGQERQFFHGGLKGAIPLTQSPLIVDPSHICTEYQYSSSNTETSWFRAEIFVNFVLKQFALGESTRRGSQSRL